MPSSDSQTRVLQRRIYAVFTRSACSLLITTELEGLFIMQYRYPWNSWCWTLRYSNADIIEGPNFSALSKESQQQALCLMYLPNCPLSTFSFREVHITCHLWVLYDARLATRLGRYIEDHLCAILGA
jgi:hypothetical protein